MLKTLSIAALTLLGANAVKAGQPVCSSSPSPNATIGRDISTYINYAEKSIGLRKRLIGDATRGIRAGFEYSEKGQSKYVEAYAYHDKLSAYIKLMKDLEGATTLKFNAYFYI